MQARLLSAALAIAMATSAGPALAAGLDELFFTNRIKPLEQQAEAMLADAESANDAEAYAWLSRAHYRQGRLDRAERVLAKAGTGTLPGLLAHGDYALFTGRFEAARGHFEAARAKAPDDVHALWGLASALLSLKRYDEAEKVAQRAHELAQGMPPTYRSHVLTVYGGTMALKAQQGFLDKVTAGPRARSMLQRAVELDPLNPYAHFALGRFYMEAPGFFGGSADKAVHELRRSVELNPHYYLAHAALIRALREAKRNDQASEELAAYKRKFEGRSEALRELRDLRG